MSPSVLVQALADLWSAIADHHPGLPTVAVTVGPEQRRPARSWGHSTWTDTLGSGPDVLVLDEAVNWTSATEALAAVLHEASHGVACARGIKDTADRGRYHNHRFRDLAWELGLVVDQADYGTGRHSWQVVGATPEALERYREPLAAVTAAGGVPRSGGKPARPIEAGPEARRDAECACESPHRITAPVKLLAAAAPHCPDCNRAYQQK